MIPKKTLKIDNREFSSDDILSVTMSIAPTSMKPMLSFSFRDSGYSYSIICRNANTIGCFMCELGTFLVSEYYTTMQVTGVSSPDKTHVIAFNVEKW